MRLDVGRLRERITFQSATVQMVAGEPHHEWSDTSSVWAEVKPASTRDLDRAGLTGKETQWRVTIRYWSEATGDMRIVWGDRLLELVGMPRDPDGMRVATEMFCVEVT